MVGECSAQDEALGVTADVGKAAKTHREEAGGTPGCAEGTAWDEEQHSVHGASA